MVQRPINQTRNISVFQKLHLKERFRNHTRDFHHKNSVNSTALSKYKEKLKDEKLTPKFKKERNSGFSKHFDEQHLLNK